MPKLNISTRAPQSFDKAKTRAKSDRIKEEISALQKILFAEKKHSLLIVIQGLDASGKDGLIADVFSGLNPFGVNVYAFKKPTETEAAHDFLWRIHPVCPPKGMIHIFNRSHYEDVLVPVVNKEIEAKTLKHRYSDINHFEKMLEHSGVTILKFYLHVSRAEQAERLKERNTNPEKYWKHNDDDWRVRRKWKSYMEAYENIFRVCNDPRWHIIPADQNWYKEYLVAVEVRNALKKMKLKYPRMKG